MTSNVLEVKNLSAGYEKKTIISNVNFTVGVGEIVGIIGANGAGKSTLLKTIRGILPRLSGSVSIFGKDTTEMTEKEYAQEVAYLQQQLEISFDYSCRELVLTGRYPYLKWWESESTDDEKVADYCMEYTGVSELADRPVTQLSGGQKQRVLLAKVLAQKTPILFLDEPTTGLDIVYQEEIFKFCQALSAAGKTIIMVVHELNLAAKYCSRIILLGDGGILADSVSGRVFTNENLTKAYHMPVKVNCNEITGGIDITVVPTEEDKVRKDYLIREICKKT